MATRYFIALGLVLMCYVWMLGAREGVVPISECCSYQIDVFLVCNVST
jgi:hypothetical protein